MNFSKLKDLVKSSDIGIKPHSTIELNKGGGNLPKNISPTQLQPNNTPTQRVPTKDVPTQRVPTKDVPTQRVPTQRMPTQRVPTQRMPTKDVPTNEFYAPINEVPFLNIDNIERVPIQRVSVERVPTQRVPTNRVPTNRVPTNRVPTNVNNYKSSIYENVGTQNVGTQKVLITKVIIDCSIDEELLKTLNKSDKLNYLAQRGWRLSTEIRHNQVYDYAIRYINRKKNRIYLGKTDTNLT